MLERAGLVVGTGLVLALATAQGDERPGRSIDSAHHHLGDDVTRDWPEAPETPEGTRLDVRFESRANASEWTLFLDQRSIDAAWRLKANGVEIARLKPAPELVRRAYPVPAGALREGENTLSFESDDLGDDVVIGALRLAEQSLRELYDTRPVSFSVFDESDRAALPARITIVDARGEPAALYYAEHPRTAVRPGVLYVGDGRAVVELPRGAYVSYATRGSEWSLSTQSFTVGGDAPSSVEHRLRREVDTTGFVAADTHIHTLQFSGHGDASADERQITLAGEGVELAIATDHNHNTDYRPFQRSLGMSRHFTAVVGNEVTTEVGHFNGFPLDPGDAIPPHDSKDYVAIVEGIRAKGAKVVILNHPRWPSHEDSPFSNHHLDQVLGRFDPPLELTVDATEMINSTTEEADPLFLFRDWFALLNAGVRIFAVGSSDSHTVGDPVGQGRTWVPSATDDPSRIDVDAACAAIANGRTSIGMGIFATLRVNDEFGPGDTVDLAHAPQQLALELRVQTPGWVAPRRALLIVNGVVVEEREVPRAPGAPTDARLHFGFEAPPHDVWVVCVVTGDDVEGPFWPLLNPYTLAATNPVFIDRDGAGWSSAKHTARGWIEDSRDEQHVRERFRASDDAVRTHMAALAVEQLGADASNAARRARILELNVDPPTPGSLLEQLYTRFE